MTSPIEQVFFDKFVICDETAELIGEPIALKRGGALAVFALRCNASALRSDNIVQITVDDTNTIIALADSSITATIA